MSQDRFHGLLIVDKPAGWTSHDVVGRIRRILGQRSVGHAGTLDPAATGVLPVAAGSALRALEFLSSASKAYRADVTFGFTTDGLDGDGRLTGQCEVPVMDEHSLRELIGSFVGSIEQIAPVYSAIKQDGTPLYERARRGEFVAPPSRQVSIHHIELIEWTAPTITVDIDCSKGFYVRSFARDLGTRAGSCAYLSNLVRTRVGPFDLCDCWTLAQLAEAPLEDEWERIALAPDVTAMDLDAFVIPEHLVPSWEQGKRWSVDWSRSSGHVRVYDSAGAWLGIGEIAIEPDRTELRPRKVVTRSTTGNEGTS